ncbi:MAG: PIN domain-containing protein [Deltaproteobacteria bacterium]|nr:PIN domain-containing protein [Deltaproteobacteria bacterium]
MKNLFIDTGAFYARYVARDQYHPDALALWKKVYDEKIGCVTSNFVLVELISLLIYRFGNKAALQAAREIYTSHAIQIISINLELELKALDWLEKFSDQNFSMTDAVSFALMEEKKLKTAFTFDHHFEIAGFEKYSVSA